MKEIIRDYITACNNSDVAGMIKHLSDNIVFRNVSNGETTLETSGKKAFKAQAEQATKLFKSRKQTIEDIQIKSNVADVTINYQEIFAQDLPNGLKADNPLHLQSRSIFTFAGDKIVKLRDKS